MNVSELISALSQHPGDMPVAFVYETYVLAPVHSVEPGTNKVHSIDKHDIPYILLRAREDESDFGSPVG